MRGGLLKFGQSERGNKLGKKTSENPDVRALCTWQQKSEEGGGKITESSLNLSKTRAGEVRQDLRD